MTYVPPFIRDRSLYCYYRLICLSILPRVIHKDSQGKQGKPAKKMGQASIKRPSNVVVVVHHVDHGKNHHTHLSHLIHNRDYSCFMAMATRERSKEIYRDVWYVLPPILLAAVLVGAMAIPFLYSMKSMP